MPAGAGINVHVTGLPVNLSQLIQDNFSDPLTVENYRRALRTWVCAFVPVGIDQTLSPFSLEGTMYAYELLDELLSGFIQQAANQTEK